MRPPASGSTPTSYRYTGQREESAIQLYWYNSRWYDSALGRFVQADTLVPDPYQPLDWDRYSFVRNNPVNYVDPTGHKAVDLPGGGTCNPREDCNPLNRNVQDLRGDEYKEWLIDAREWLTRTRGDPGIREGVERELSVFAFKDPFLADELGINPSDVLFSVFFGGVASFLAEVDRGLASSIIRNQRILGKSSNLIYEGDIDLRPTLDRILSSGRYPHRNDGTVWRNDKGPLPVQTDPNYYYEYVVPTPGSNGPGPQRIILGAGGEIIYTPDHYSTFIWVNR